MLSAISANTLLVPFAAFLLLHQPLEVESKATFGIGMRIIGDQLLVKDVLQVRPTGRDESTSAGFQYAIPEPITYIEILSEENVQAYVSFSYQNDLVAGTISTPVPGNDNNKTDAAMTHATLFRAFVVKISIYGFNETIHNVDPVYILNRNQDFTGVLEPDELYLREGADADYEEYLNIDEDGLEDFDEDNNAAHDDRSAGDGDEDWEDEDMDADFEHKDKIIEVGRRQRGDSLIYSTYQTSSSTTEYPTNHSLVFYYIDSDFITYARFVVFDHFNDKSRTADYQPPIAEYSHYSPNTLKAVITDPRTTNLFVQMFLYGYKPKDLPVDYMPFLLQKGGISGGTTDSPMSPLQSLKALMQAQLHGGHTESSTTAEAEGEFGSSHEETAAEEENDGQQLQIGAKSNMACLTGGATASALLLIESWNLWWTAAVAVILSVGRFNSLLW